MTVGELRDRLETNFHDSDEISFEVCLDGPHRTSYYGNSSVFISSIEPKGLGEGGCEIHISGDVDEEQ